LLLASCVTPDPPGRSVIRLERKADEPFASVVRSLDAAPYRGRVVVVSARLRSAGIEKGPNGVWVRTDGPDGKLLGFSDSYARALVGDSDWTERKAVLEVDPGAQRIVFGAVNSSPGSLWVEGIEVRAIDEASAAPLSAEASTYLEDALATVRKRAYYSSRVDWDRARPMARAIAGGAQTTAETYDAIRYVLRLLGDHHSHLIGPAEVREQRVSTARDFKIAGATLGAIGYVGIPGYNGQDAARSQAFASAIEGRIAEGQAAHVCRWIVDLRDDIGGNMSPMLAGLHPLLGDATAGYFHNRSGEWIPWSASKGSSLARESSSDFVAVIAGHRTASAGEAVMLSFRGRPHTRSFGQPTAGQSTANQGISLPDGAALALTTGLMADRHRNLASGAIEPDERVKLPDLVKLEDDTAVAAATAWLQAQACTSIL
jgi:C-terminal processing protease CtpA/Prc